MLKIFLRFPLQKYEGLKSKTLSNYPCFHYCHFFFPSVQDNSGQVITWNPLVTEWKTDRLTNRLDYFSDTGVDTRVNNFSLDFPLLILGIGEHEWLRPTVSQRDSLENYLRKKKNEKMAEN